MAAPTPALEERYRVISLQFESLRHLGNTLEEWVPNNDSDALRRLGHDGFIRAHPT